MATVNEEAFLNLLIEVQNSAHTLAFAGHYDTSKIINVNLETREIELSKSPYKKFISVSDDHYADTLYFRMPRFYDNVDLMSMALVVEYVNANGEGYISPIVVKDIASEPGYIIFGWCVHGNAAIAAGTLKFAFHLFQIDLNTHEIVYSLRTQAATGRIVLGLKALTKEYETGLLNTYSLDEVIAGLVQNTTLWWTNL